VATKEIALSLLHTVPLSNTSFARRALPCAPPPQTDGRERLFREGLACLEALVDDAVKLGTVSPPPRAGARDRGGEGVNAPSRRRHREERGITKQRRTEHGIVESEAERGRGGGRWVGGERECEKERGGEGREGGQTSANMVWRKTVPCDCKRAERREDLRNRRGLR